MLTKNQEKLIRSLAVRKNRKKSGLFVAEGLKLVTDLMKAGLEVENIYLTEGNEQHFTSAVQMNEISLRDMKSISFLETPSP
ncbi:MAG TPA: RNA methyltransferase, partial [Cryomorphaceae bacterium]|nr:RNA methyltransferase [Cryomorphaceae bacterium]